MRKLVMAGNWKMNKTIGEAVSLAQEISNEYDNYYRNRCCCDHRYDPYQHV